MGLVIDLGLERLFDDEEKRCAAITRIVADGHAKRLREIFWKRRGVLGRVFEARREDDGVSTRWLEDAEVAEIQERYTERLGTKSHVGFAWADLEKYGADNIQDLAFNMISPVAQRRTKVALSDETTVHAIDTQASLLNWGDDDETSYDAMWFHMIAIDHDLIVHSA